jgi:HlyD family secretion protein
VSREATEHRPDEEAKTTCFALERRRPGPPLVPQAQSPLFAQVREPHLPPRVAPLDRPWITLGGERDDIPLRDRAAGPGQIVLRPQDGQVFLECSPLCAGVKLGGATVYRAILHPGDRFRVGRAEITIAPDGAVPQTALTRMQPQVLRLLAAVEVARAQPRRLRVAMALTALALLGVCCPTRVTVSADCELTAAARGWVRSPLAGFVQEVRVREGEHVRKGQLLATVAVPDVERDLVRVRHEIEGARAQLAQAERGARPTELLMAQARERAAHTRSLYLERSRERVERLVKQGLESRQALDDASRDSEAARAEAELAQLAVAQLDSGAPPEEIAQRRAELEKLFGERDFLVHQRGRAELPAPADGVVATPRLSELVGKFVPPGTELMVVVDERQLVFEARVPEKEIEFVHAGAPVRLRLKGDPEHPIEGVVEEVAPRVEETATLGRVVPVRCRVDTAPAAALAGLTGAAQIVGPRTSWLGLLGKRLYRWVRTDLL